MKSQSVNFGRITPLHTDFGNNPGDLLVVEYDVPQPKVKKTLFYKYGQLSIPKWALIPAGILTFGLVTALCAIIANSILSQSVATVTYSQACSKTSKCDSNFGLICNSQSICACQTGQYWYEDNCVSQPTYTEQCNQTTECRTDLGLMCTEIDGLCNCPNTTIIQTCDCSSTSYWTGSICTNRMSYLGACTVPDISYQCLPTLYCNGSRCICSPKTQYWNSTANECYSVDKYGELCDPSTSYSCDASVQLYCLQDGQGTQCPFSMPVNATSCDCANGTYWNGGSCVSKKSYDSSCFWPCECNNDVGLQCLNMSCLCPSKFYWSTSTSMCEPQKNYTEGPCTNTTHCDTTQGLVCYSSGMTACNCPASSTLNTCDCLPTQFYDYNLTSCQKLHLYNESCLDNYMCDSTVGLFCQMTLSSSTNCSCPEPIRLSKKFKTYEIFVLKLFSFKDMCDCNMTSYWDGTHCVSRLAPNVSCTYDYECQSPYICIVNQTDNGIFSDVCRCPLGSYYVTGQGCVLSKNYTDVCEGSYQCYELAPLSCRFNDTGLTCLYSDDFPLPRCDCSDNYYYEPANHTCVPLLKQFDTCTDSCQCTKPYECVGSNKCDCEKYYSTLRLTCVEYLDYGDNCTTTAQCNDTENALMSCVNSKCGCGSDGFWNGSQCIFQDSFRMTCTHDNNCAGDLKCRAISCLGSGKRCACPDDEYYVPSSKDCVSCKNNDVNFTRYVINYPYSDICVAVYWPSSSKTLSFATANTQCNSLTQMANADTPTLLSVHNQTELNCIAAKLHSEEGSKECDDNRYYHLGYNSTTEVFYDGTLRLSSFPSVSVTTAQCLVYCYEDDSTGKLSGRTCTGSDGGNRYGAICDYRVYS